jgi:raffinose/stachyose/melibiose transport system permease protein
VNATLGAAGLEQLQRVWLGDPATALAAVSVVSGWVYAGFYMMIFYAAFRQVPHEVIEAGRLDGAGEWALFRRLKVPMIRSAVWVAVLLCVTGGFQGFDLFFVLTNGGPYGSTEIPTTYLVKTVFRNGDVGYGSAMAVVLTAIVLGVGLVYSRLSRRQGAAVPVDAPARDIVGAGPAVVERLVVPEQAS